jgi:AraC-like DNA-binding protein
MNADVKPQWWPERLLRRHPVRRVFVCGQRLHPPQFSHAVHFPRIEMPLKGAYENQIEGGDKIIRAKLLPGDVLFAAPNCWNLPEWQPGLELLSILFGRSQIVLSMVAARGRRFTQLATKKISIPRPLTGATSHILNALMELQNDKGPPDAFPELMRALMRCIEELLRQPAAKPVSRAHILLEDIRVFLQSHYQYEITRDSVARQFAITPNHLSRLFQTHGRVTFSSYLTHVRIDRAKHLLRTYNLKLDDIAARCGYHDTPYFCHVFKNVTKSTPMEYKLKIHRAPA